VLCCYNVVKRVQAYNTKHYCIIGLPDTLGPGHFGNVEEPSDGHLAFKSVKWLIKILSRPRPRTSSNMSATIKRSSTTDDSLRVTIRNLGGIAHESANKSRLTPTDPLDAVT